MEITLNGSNGNQPQKTSHTSGCDLINELMKTSFAIEIIRVVRTQKRCLSKRDERDTHTERNEVLCQER